jgi:hypothetical protein
LGDDWLRILLEDLLLVDIFGFDHFLCTCQNTGNLLLRFRL